jgi:hypothetical protein
MRKIEEDEMNARHRKMLTIGAQSIKIEEVNEDGEESTKNKNKTTDVRNPARLLINQMPRHSD